MRNSFTLLVMYLFSGSLLAQVGGEHIYEFLNLSPSARVTALGEYQVSVYDDDANLAYMNPAALNEQSHSQLNFSQTFHFTDITNGYFSYAHFIKKHNISFHGGLQYINYGDFNLTDEYGQISGTFKVGEQALTLGASKALNENYSVGSNVKFIFSSFESYRSAGMALDLGGMYHQDEKKFSAGFVIKNIGTQFTAYDIEREPLPFDVVAGVSKQLAHLPLRFSLIAHHLHRWNITYDDPNLENNRLFTNSFAVGLDNFFRHFVINGEFLLGKGGPLRLRFGYNHFRRRELTLTDFLSFAGYSGGFGIKAKRWRVDYGFNIYHLHGSVHHLSFGTSLNSFKKQKI
ncbi:type IX secretion system protein PorQ [Portibacter lacus]|uniref:Type IX secretion system protein PorQ n=1 Tax=Portibacter lacus TaxID=1099794 RepID=A0AA37SPP2_9BACT|nr:type IX secretion system protein PorQ [Portibacter lacus]GLR17852.1 hypothetical protein GCM10007940_24670 [Portibacter lacus]